MNYSPDEKPAGRLPDRPQRRRLLALLLFAALPAAAATLEPTPAQMLGPFYPPHFDPGAGNDLASVNGRDRAAGIALRVVGRVVDGLGRPLPDVRVEIWQTNAHGRYHHPGDDNPAPLDPNFRGYGRTTTDADGAYAFRTVMPVAYPGRTPHIHFKLVRDERTLLVTQMYLPDQAERNRRDALFNAVGDPAARQRLLGVTVAASGEPTLRFDIVLAGKLPAR